MQTSTLKHANNTRRNHLKRKGKKLVINKNIIDKLPSLY